MDWKKQVGCFLFAAAVLALGFALLQLGGCSLDFSQTSTQNQNGNPSGPTGVSPTASPSPGAPGAAVATVRVAEIGREECGLVIDPTVLPPPPCKAILTCTPLDKDGKDVGLSYKPEWIVTGPGGVTPTSLNPYNARAECDGPSGSILVTCSVSDKLGVKGYACRG